MQLLTPREREKINQKQKMKRKIQPILMAIVISLTPIFKSPISQEEAREKAILAATELNAKSMLRGRVVGIIEHPNYNYDLMILSTNTRPTRQEMLKIKSTAADFLSYKKIGVWVKNANWSVIPQNAVNLHAEINTKHLNFWQWLSTKDKREKKPRRPKKFNHPKRNQFNQAFRPKH